VIASLRLDSSPVPVLGFERLVPGCGIPGFRENYRPCLFEQEIFFLLFLVAIEK
jgi:hypothetical protein